MVNSVRESLGINTNSVYTPISPHGKRRVIKMKCHDWFVTLIFVIFLCLQLNGVQCSNKGRSDPATDAEDTQDIIDLGRPKSDSLELTDGLNVFQIVDPSFKGKYLIKKDVPSFMAIMGKKRGIKISELEINLFLYSADTNKDGKISAIEYSNIMVKPSTVLPSSFMNLRSESLGDNSLERDCIYEEDLELLSENAEYDFLLLDTNKDECFSFKEFQAFFSRYGSEDVSEDIINGETSDEASDKIIKNNDKPHLNKPSTAEETKWDFETDANSIYITEESVKYSIFEGFDRTIKGYLLKIDLPHFLGHKAKLNEGDTIFELEVNLFLYTVDTDKDNKISEMEYINILAEPLSIVTSSFIKLRSESNSLDKDCIYSEDLELRSDDTEYEFQILDVDSDDCLSFSEFKDFFSIFGIQFPRDVTANSETSYPSETVDHESVSDAWEEKNAHKTFYKTSLKMEGDHEFKSKEAKVEEPYGTQSERLSDLLFEDENIFHDFDRTYKGYLTKDEVSSFMLYNGNLPEMQRVSELEVNLFLHTIDADRDGMISENEYTKANSNNRFNDCISRSYFYLILNEDVQNEIYYKYISKIKSLCLSKSNLKVLSGFAEYDFELLDTDNDKCLSFEEFEDFFVRYGMTSSLQKYLIYGQGYYGSDEYESFFFIRSPLTYPGFKVSGPDAVQLVKFANIVRDIILEEFDLNVDGDIDNTEIKDDLTTTIFADLDTNGDKRISSDELTDAATEEFLQMLVLAKERLNSLAGRKKDEQIILPPAFTIFDSDKNGNMNSDEYKFLMEVHRKFIAKQIVISKVAQYDYNVDHRISLAEFSHSIQGNIEIEVENEEDDFGNSFGANSVVHNSSHLIEVVFNHMDENADGYVDEEEYLIFLRQLYSDAQLKNFFAIADVDNDGFVSGRVIHILLTKVVKPFVKEDDVLSLETFMKIYYDTIMSIVSESEMEEQFAVLDDDGDSVISAEEFKIVEIYYEIDGKSDFVVWLDEYLQRNFLEIQENADFTDSFSLFDYNRNGYITKEEFKDALDILMEGPHTIEDINRWFVRLDMNGDNVISMTEFDLLLMK